MLDSADEFGSAIAQCLREGNVKKAMSLVEQGLRCYSKTSMQIAAEMPIADEIKEVKIANDLEKIGVLTFADLLKTHESEIKEVNNIGCKTLSKLMEECKVAIGTPLWCDMELADFHYLHKIGIHTAEELMACPTSKLKEKIFGAMCTRILQHRKEFRAQSE